MTQDAVSFAESFVAALLSWRPDQHRVDALILGSVDHRTSPSHAIRLVSTNDAMVLRANSLASVEVRVFFTKRSYKPLVDERVL